MDFSDYRQDYTLGSLHEQDLPAVPAELFRTWFEAILQTGKEDPTAMVLATATAAGRPSCRMVLLKAFEDDTFVFYTNYESRKATELGENPFASLLFYWPAFERQLRIEGQVAMLEAKASDSYFRQRPPESRLSALVSPQSREIPSRQWLETRLEALRQQADPETVARPPHWGGYRLFPHRYEFWQGRPDRLHDRIVYERSDAGWNRFRLAP